MNSAALKKAFFKIFLPGTLLAVTIAVAAKLFLDVEQCPDGYTQQQVDAAGCVVGANIGLGLAWLSAIAIEVIALLTTLVMYMVWRRRTDI